MQRITTQPRNNWQTEVEKLGFGFHTTEVPYWDESVYYSFTLDEVLLIEKATTELWDLCLGAVQHVIDNKLYTQFSIPEQYITLKKAGQKISQLFMVALIFALKMGN
jgi:glutathionylspermidine synthase